MGLRERTWFGRYSQVKDIETLEQLDFQTRSISLLIGLALLAVLNLYLVLFYYTDAYPQSNVKGLLVAFTVLDFLLAFVFAFWLNLGSKRKSRSIHLIPYVALFTVSLTLLFRFVFLPSVIDYFSILCILMMGVMHRRYRVYLMTNFLTSILLLVFLYRSNGLHALLGIPGGNDGDLVSTLVYIFFYILVSFLLFDSVFAHRYYQRSANTIYDETVRLSNQLTSQRDVIVDTIKGLNAFALDLGKQSNMQSQSLDGLVVASREVGKAIEHQASSVSDIYASLQQTVQSLDHFTQELASIAENSNATAELSNKGREQLSAFIGHLKAFHAFTLTFQEGYREMVEKLNQIIKHNEAIQQVAQATNILSLNASIESARAGEHGKGFSVIAAEIRKLSKQSSDLAKAVQQTTVTLCAGAEKNTKALESGKAVFDQIRKSVEVVDESFSSIVDAVHGVDSSTQNMMVHLTQIHDNTKVIEGSLGEFSSSLQQSSASTQEMVATLENLASFNKTFDSNVSAVQTWSHQLLGAVGDTLLEFGLPSNSSKPTT